MEIIESPHSPKKFSLKTFFPIVSIFAVAVITILPTKLLTSQNQTIKSRAAVEKKLISLERSTIDFTISSILGQPNERETMTKRIVPNRGFKIGGVHIDSQDRIYIYDSGNNRILGFRFYQGADQNADIVIGQPAATDMGTANGDNTRYLPPGASTLATLEYPSVVTTGESARSTHMATDQQDSLYVMDPNNNRVLKFIDPFNTDQIADDVWGQPDFTTRQSHCGYNDALIDGSSFCTGWGTEYNPGGGQIFQTGVAIDSNGNLWVADTGNNRVLRFPNNGGIIQKTADLVLGQSDFTKREQRSVFDIRLDRMIKPIEVQVKPSTGEVYILEGEKAGQERMIVFTPPFTNGMSATKEIGRALFQDDQPTDTTNWEMIDSKWVHTTTGLYWARGFAFDPTNKGDFWINDGQSNARMLLYDSAGQMMDIINKTNFDLKGCHASENDGYIQVDGTEANLCGPTGEIGFDSQNNLYVSSDANADQKDVIRFPLPLIRNAMSLPVSNGWLIHKGENQYSAKNFNNPNGISYSLTTTPSQLYVSDNKRILVFNNFPNLSTYQSADYVIGQDDVNGYPDGGIFGAVNVWSQCTGGGYLWVASNNRIFVFQIPITSSGSDYVPSKILFSSSTPSDNGNIYWSDDINQKVNFSPSGLVYDESTHTLWISDENNNRVLRVSDPLGTATADLVLGQPSKESIGDNAGLGNQPNRKGFARPWSLNFDQLGNLYVLDSKYEGGGNNRVLRFNKADLTPNGNLFPLPDASGVYAKKGFDSTESWGEHTPTTPTWVGFNKDNQIIMLVDGGGNLQNERVYLYSPDHATQETPQHISIVPLSMGQGAFAYFFTKDQLIIQDHTWNRLMFLTLISPPITPSIIPPTETPIPTNSPTPTTTPTPILRNGSFEDDIDNNSLPDNWTVRNLDTNDILDSLVFYDGSKSFKFSPSSLDKKEQIFQTLNLSGNGDEEIRLDLYNQSDANVTSGKAGVVLHVLYKDGTQETSSAIFPYRAHSWKNKTLIIVTDKAYSKIKVQFLNTNKDTNYRVDKANISIIPEAIKRGIKDTGNEIPPNEIDTQ